MGIEIKFEYESIKDFEKRIQTISESLRNSFFAEALANLGHEAQGEATQRTPRRTGHLAGSWGINKTTKNGDTWMLDIINPVEYAIYVEEGHRQEVGRFVPVLGKRLKAPFVEGRHMLRDSIDEKVKPYMEEYLAEKLTELFVKG